MPQKYITYDIIHIYWRFQKAILFFKFIIKILKYKQSIIPLRKQER